MQRIAKAIILGGIFTLAVGLAICLVMVVYVVMVEDIGTIAYVLIFLTGSSVAGVVLGIGFPMLIVGIIFDWMFGDKSETEPWLGRFLPGLRRYPPRDQPQPADNQPEQEGDAYDAVNHRGGVNPGEELLSPSAGRF